MKRTNASPDPQTQALAAAMPFNANKSQEYGATRAANPPAGETVKSESRLPTGSTVTEENGTQKTGSTAVEGVNANIETLDRVRVDSGGQKLTTNQGVPIADNQSSLKAGLRGPVLLEDFILREKITHFDHERIRPSVPAQSAGNRIEKSPSSNAFKAANTCRN